MKKVIKTNGETWQTCNLYLILFTIKERQTAELPKYRPVGTP